MNYFNGIEIFDKVWSFEYGYGKVIELNSNFFEVEFDCCVEKYSFDGIRYDCSNCNQTLFWDKIEINKSIVTAPVKLKEELFMFGSLEDKSRVHKYNNFQDEYYRARRVFFGLCRNDKETAEKALEQLKRFSKLLALRDQECKDSRGYFPKELEEYYYIFWDSNEQKYKVNSATNKMYMNIIPFKTEEDAQEICSILNKNRFDLDEDF